MSVLARLISRRPSDRVATVLTVAVALLSVAMVPKPVEAPPDRPCRHQGSGFVFPAETSGYRRVHVLALDEQMRGIACTYHPVEIAGSASGERTAGGSGESGPAAAFTVYVTPAKESAEDAIRRAGSNIAGAVKQAEVVTMSKFTLRQGKREFAGGVHLALDTRETESAPWLRTVVYVVENKGYLYQYRGTCPRDDFAKTNPRFAALIASMPLPE